MRDILAIKQRQGARVVFLIAIIFNFSAALNTYINSTFLTDITKSENIVSLIFTVGSVFAIIGLAFIPVALSRFGSFTTTLVTIILSILTVLGLAWLQNPIAVVILFLFYITLSRFIFYEIDLLLEHFSQDSTTGRIRGAFLSITSLAFLFGPTIAGFVLGENNYARLYTLTAILLALSLPIFIYTFKSYKDPVYDRTPFWKTLRKIYRRDNMRRLFSAYFLLRFFYAWMVIYTPIYLHEYIGLSWATIGVVFTIMLLPFVLLEYPLGKIADTKFGEKEIMALGFIIIILATTILTFITSTSWWVWAIALFMTRVGASMIESMAQIYFYKKIDDSDSELLGFFLMTAPIAYAIAPLAASVVLAFLDFRFLYLVLGIIMLFGLPYVLKLKDTL